MSGRRVSRLALVVALAATSAHAATLRERAAAIDAPARGPAMTLDGPLAIGRGRITVPAGTRVYPLVAGGTSCGLLVDGPARLEYRVEDAISMPVAARNLDHGSKLAFAGIDGVLRVSEDLDGAVVWGRGLAPSAALAPATPSALPGWASKVIAGRRSAPPSHGLLAEQANGGEGLRYALLSGRHGTFVLHVDPIEGEENLYRMAPALDPGTTFRSGLRPIALATQPIGHAWWERVPRALIAVHEALDVENPAGERIHVHSRTRLRADRAGMTLWPAQLVSTLYDSNGRQLEVTMRSVSVDGKPADFLHDDDELLVDLGRTLKAGETIEVEADYEGDLAQRPAGNSYWMLGTYPWYPRQELSGELATIELKVDVPAPLTPFASGAEVARTGAGPRRTVTSRLDEPEQFAVVVAGRYETVQETRGDVTCRAATYAMLNERGARELINKFFAGIAVFEPLFGEKYPFRDFSIIELMSWGFGQAPPGIMFFTHEFYTAPLPGRTRAFFHARDPRFLHEVAHGWWGNVAKMPSSEEAWWSEALADYSAALAFWQLRGAAGDQAFADIVRDWSRDASDIGPGASLFLSTRFAFTDDRDAADFWRLRYAKGPLVIHAIRLELQKQKGSAAEGDRYFIAFLRAFLQRTRGGFATTADMVKTLDELTGTEWQPWFLRYVYGTEVPKV